MKAKHRLVLLILLLLSTQLISGCLLTKVVTVPMRVVGAVVSIIPTTGDGIHDALDATAEAIDVVPF